MRLPPPKKGKRFMRGFMNDQRGMVIVEAAFVFPFVILITVCLYFTAIYMAQAANMQAAIEMAVVRQGYSISDTNLVLLDSGDTAFQPKLSEPYRRFFLKNRVSEDTIKNKAHAIAAVAFLSGADKFTVEIKIQNYVVYQKLTASAVQTLHPPINLSFLGVPSEIHLQSSAAYVVNDPDEFCRTTDIAFDVAAFLDEKYHISDKITSALDKAAETLKGLFQ